MKRRSISLVIDRDLLRPGESFLVFEPVDVVTQHPSKQGMESSDPQLLGDLPANARSQLTLLHWWQRAPWMPELTLRQRWANRSSRLSFISLTALLVKVTARIRRISSVLANQMGATVSQCTHFATAGSRHNQHRALVTTHRQALGIIEAGKKPSKR